MRNYRGLTKEGKWVFGSYVEIPDKHHFIIVKQMSFYHYREVDGRYPAIYNPIEVIPETVGQFTGLKDKNGTEIYKGDAVSSGFWDGIVEFVEGAFKIVQGGCSDSTNFDVTEIIGNIHENPELLKG